MKILESGKLMSTASRVSSSPIIFNILLSPGVLSFRGSTEKLINLAILVHLFKMHIKYWEKHTNLNY